MMEQIHSVEAVIFDFFNHEIELSVDILGSKGHDVAVCHKRKEFHLLRLIINQLRFFLGTSRVLELSPYEAISQTYG